MAASSSQRVMSGMRSTGRLHIGHYLGVLQNWVQLQQTHTCFFMVADWHALTTQYAHPENIVQHRLEMVLDWLAVGVDPEQATLYIQSEVPEIAELHLLLSMLVPKAWLEGSPTLKDLLKGGECHYGVLGYPVLQTADILAPRGEFVPVGKDQLAHLEISRDIARRFNHLYGEGLLPEPKPLLTETPLVKGLDGNKMGKSSNNGILISDTEDETVRKIKTAITDRNRIQKTDPGDPTQCEVVFPYYQLFASDTAISLTDSDCRQALRGCMDCKKQLAEIVNEWLRPMRQRRADYAQQPDQVRQVLNTGRDRMRAEAQHTLTVVKTAMKLL
ncbi:MAG: tryptophan--tRNA ligase [Vampirovibrionales bacterium]